MNETNSAIDRFSSIKYTEKVIQLALPITFVSNENAGVIEILDSWIRQYKSQLDGILVSYSNVSLLSRKNKIIGDKFCLLVDIKAKFKLFCPNIGDIVLGKINRISKEHIGCLMHDTINVVIKLTEYFPDELNKFMRIERDILFEITHFGCRRKEIIVKGKITPDCLKLMNELIPVIEDEEVTSFSYHNQNNITRYDFDDIDDTPTIIKTEPLTSPNHLPDNITNNNAFLIPEISNSISNSPTKEAKKSKKRKRTSSASDESLTSTNHLPGNIVLNNASLISAISNSMTDSPTVHSKKSKKRKRTSSVSDDSLISPNHLLDNIAVKNVSLIPKISNSIFDSPTNQTKKSKKHKRNSSASNQSLSSTSHLSDNINSAFLINEINPNDPISNSETKDTKKSQKLKRDNSTSAEKLHKKRKNKDKEKKTKAKKDKKLGTKKTGLVASGEVLKNSKKFKKKHSKKGDKSKDKKSRKKLKKKHTKEESKHDVNKTISNIEIKSEF